MTAAPVYGNNHYLMVNPLVARRYFPQGGFIPQPPTELFRARKPANGYRIFVLGESTTAGWPYPSNVMFTRSLQQRLADAFPDKYVEIVNTGIAAVSSYTLVDFIDEILQQQPDAILIYAGHNEFYGALGAASSESVGQSRWIIKAYLHLLNFKTFQLMRNSLNAALYRLSPPPGAHPTLMGRMIGNPSISYDSSTYQNARANYAANLRDIFITARQAGVPVMISELVSNIRDHKPFVSVNDNKNPTADAVYAQAQAWEREQKFDLAKAAYIRARDLDGMRFRAPEEFNTVIHQVAAEYKVPVVPLVSFFEKKSAHGIIGSSLMLEHLHPNADGYLLMSDAFFDAMREQRFISAHWDESRIMPASFYRDAWPVTDFDRALGEIRIIGLTDHWPYPSKTPGERSIANFQARNQAEAIAYQQFKGELSFYDGHLKMADYYEANGKHALALREYYALISTEPYNSDFYFPAVKAGLTTPEEFAMVQRYIKQLETLGIAPPKKMRALRLLLDQQQESLAR